MITKGCDFSISQFEEEGYCGPIQALTIEEANYYYHEFFKVLGQSPFKPGPTNKVLSAWHHTHRWAFELATHPSIVAAMSQILGEDVVLWAMHFWYKEPNNSKYIPWHQDINYWPMEPAINATAWMSLGYSLQENGCLRIIPGSHRQLVEHTPTGNSASEFENAIANDKIDIASAIDVEMSPGQMALFNEATFHGSEMNSSNIPRVAFSVRYTTPEVKFNTTQFGGDPDRIKTFLIQGQDRFHLNDDIIGVPPQK